MKYHELQATPNKNRKRVGRGISAGRVKLLVAVPKVKNLVLVRRLKPALWAAKVL